MGQSTWGERMKFIIRMNSISLLVVLLTVAAGSAEDKVARKPKLFFVSTSATTTTLQTLSVCYYTSGSLTTCTGRKRRAIDVDGVMLSDVKSLKDSASTELESSHREEGTSIDGSRDGRFLLYWITTTSISTSTSFTTTYTVDSVLCTAPGSISVDRQKNNQSSISQCRNVSCFA